MVFGVGGKLALDVDAVNRLQHTLGANSLHWRHKTKKRADLHPRRRAFQIRPSRLPTVSDAHDYPITKPAQISPNSQEWD